MWIQKQKAMLQKQQVIITVKFPNKIIKHRLLITPKWTNLKEITTLILRVLNQDKERIKHFPSIMRM